ncbi:hypothetical protein [Bradyrhizobium sp. 6(2017)]|uniref:hypothetical protein n=1 Tax=Bradyrhizobium sp. 6(2017) TaxID=1197460 RepID=UPI0039C8AE9F
MYVALARVFNEVAHNENMQVVLWHGAGDSFCAGNNIEEFFQESSGATRAATGRPHACIGQLRKAIGRGGPRRRNRWRHHYATHFDFIYRGREYEITDALHQSCYLTAVSTVTHSQVRSPCIAKTLPRRKGRS